LTIIVNGGCHRWQLERIAVDVVISLSLSLALLSTVKTHPFTIVIGGVGLKVCVIDFVAVRADEVVVLTRSLTPCLSITTLVDDNLNGVEVIVRVVPFSMLTVERMVINSVLRPHLYFFTTTPVKGDYLVTTIIGGAVFFIVLAEYSV
jgi:hypothetical protein